MAKRTINKQTKRDNKTKTIRIFNVRSKNSPIDIKFGKFTANRVCLEETAINNKVLRISIESTIKNNPRKSIKKPDSTRNTQRKLVENKYKSRQLLLRKRTRSKYRHNKTRNDPLRITQNLKLFHKLRKKRESQTMTSIEAMIPEFKINKSIKKTATTTTAKTSNYKYLLKSTPNLCNYEPSKLCLDFIELPKMLSSIKLPDPTWKIKIFMKDIMTMSIRITNNKSPQRCVIFTAKNQCYQIIIDDIPIRLLGCPKTLSNPNDFETLIHIVSCISLNDCMVSPLTTRHNF